MDQKDAARHAREMANGIASIYQSEGLQPASNRMQQFHNAAFAHVFELIPDTALATVVSLTEDEGQPILVAIDGQQFYKLFFEAFEFRSDDVPITTCEMTRIDPSRGYVRVEAQYDPSAPATAPRRETAWTFGIDERFNLTFNTRFDPGDVMDETEKFARGLASALGWDIPEASG
ncbi:MAG: hypothetical protein JST59_05915 [Actinobacteria bacterium]|nr:hypothetical protein [Actinomycetota bacterium]